MKEKNELCNYKDPENFSCPNHAEHGGVCYWHDKSVDKTGPDVKSKLEEYARNDGFLRGVVLEQADLKGIDLVKHRSKIGYDMSYADLYRADLRHAHMFNITLAHSSLMKANLTKAKLNCANLTGSNLLGVIWKDSKIENIALGKKLYQETLAKTSLKSNQNEKAADYYEQAEEVYRDLRKHTEHAGMFRLSGILIQRELTMRRMQSPKFSVKRLTSKCIDLFCGYGEAPLRIIGISMIIILICAMLYTFTGLSYQGTIVSYDENLPISDNINLFFSCLYYSIVTFTTLGYGDFTPVGISRAIAALEAFTGSFTLALFVVVFVKKMTR
jgi:hypothetical protein